MIRKLWNSAEFPVLLAGVVVAGGLWGFVEMAEVARGGVAHNLDTEILLAFREPGAPDNPIGPQWFEEAMRDITSLGSTAVLLLIATASIIFLLLIRKRFEALLVLVAIGGGQLISSLLKLGIDRPRPHLVSHLAHVQTLSFPSGHAMISAITYLTLGALLASSVSGRVTRIYILAVAVMTTLLVGISRVYLGVHWPSDVLAGWCAGFAWSMICWLAARYWARAGRKAVPRED